MADTSKENILTIAPELTSFVSNTRQSTTLTVSTAQDSRDYTVAIDGVEYSANSGVGATVISIATALYNAISAAALAHIETVDNGDGTLTIRAYDAGIRFDINTDTDPFMSVSIDTAAQLGHNLLQLILEDVRQECQYARYRDEQERAQRYLAAHLLTVLYDTGISTSGTAGDIIREKVGDVETWYSDGGTSTSLSTSDSDLKNSKYGRTFMSIRARHSVCFI